jgi:FKBP-type peptidyl-prolyl cis-trans isomerase SlyD
MNIEKNTAVTLRYRVTDQTGRLLEDGQTPTAYLHGGYGNTFPKLEAALEGQSAGFELKLELSPQDAFGERDENLVQTIAKRDFPPGVKVGGQLEGRGPDGQPRVFTVLKVKGDQVLLDGNHPLAGKSLRLQAKVLEVRAASP